MTRRLIECALLVAALAVVGCSSKENPCRKNTLRLTLDYSAAPTATDLSIDAVVDNGATLTGSFTKPAGTSGTAEIDFGAGYPSGTRVDITARALESGNVVAVGMGSVTLAPTCSTLSIIMQSMGPTQQQIMISPPMVTLKVGDKQTFMANIPVDWSVMEGAAGGTISTTGDYVAPAAAGTYHVVATSQADATVTGSATVMVTPWVLDVLAGHLGGTGNADGVGADARFDGARGLASDTMGHLYITDFANRTVRRFDIASGAVSTIAGSPGQYGTVDGVGFQARFKSLQAIVSDRSQYLYVSDYDDYILRRIDTASHAVTTVAGTPGVFGFTDGVGAAAQFRTIYGLYYDIYHGVYAADLGNAAVRRISTPDYTVTTLRDGANTALSFTTATDVFVDESFAGAPKIYVAYTGGTFDVVTVGQNTPTTSTARSTLATRIPLLNGFVLDGLGNIIGGALGSAGPPTVKQLVISTGSLSNLAGGAASQVDGIGGAAGFNSPQKPFFDGASYVYVTDGCCLRRIDVSTKAVTTVAGTVPVIGTTDDVGTKASFTKPGAMLFDGAHTAYVVDQGSTIRKIDVPSGTVSTLVGPVGATPSPLTHVSAMFLDGTGNLYALDLHAGDFSYTDIMQVTSAGAVTKIFDGNSPTRHDFVSLAYDGSANMYVGENDAIWQIPLASPTLGTMPVAGVAGMAGKTDTADGTALFSSVQALAWGGANTLLVADGAAVRKVVFGVNNTATTSTIAGVADNPGSADGTGANAKFTNIVALANNGAGVLFVVDGSTVRRLDLASGAVVTWFGVQGVDGVTVGARPASLNKPAGIASLGGEELLVSDEYAVLHAH